MTSRHLHMLRLYWETLRHLKPAQIANRVRRLALPAKYDGRPFAGSVREFTGPWVQTAQRPVSMIGPSAFRFLSVTADADHTGWDNPETDKLWRYNLHYFDDLCADYAPQRAAWHHALVERWMRENPPLTGSGWEPYPVSLRIVNWIKAALSGFALTQAAQASLALQARWLSQNLEYHLLANHLFANAKALLFAGLYFHGAEAEQWLRTGVAILRKELDEQILPDGGQFELSPMYHAIALEDVLDMGNLLRALGVLQDNGTQQLLDQLDSKAQAMRRWLGAMSHPDGSLSHFNDCAQNIAPTLAALSAYATRLGMPVVNEHFQGITHLAESGYVRNDNGPFVAIMDVGEVGPAYQPGHAHADTLSLELSIAGTRILVNSGTSVYGISAERLRQRGTPAHNSVSVNDENSSEVWSGFRVARRAKPFDLDIASDPSPRVACSHDGFRRLKGGPIHRRALQVTRDSVVITDQLTDGVGTGVAHYHFHPDCSVAIAPDGASGAITTPAGGHLGWSTAGCAAAIEPSSYHPDFGTAVPSMSLLVPIRDGTAELTIDWAA